MKTTLLPEVNLSILKMIGKFDIFNHELNIKRKKSVSELATLKEIEVGGKLTGLGEIDPTEFKKLNPLD